MIGVSSCSLPIDEGGHNFCDEQGNILKRDKFDPYRSAIVFDDLVYLGNPSCMQSSYLCFDSHNIRFSFPTAHSSEKFVSELTWGRLFWSLDEKGILILEIHHNDGQKDILKLCAVHTRKMERH